MARKIKLTKKEEKGKIKEKLPISQEEANTLEQRIKKEEEEAGEDADIREIREFLQSNSEIQRFSPSLEKTNAAQRIPVRLERNLLEDPTATQQTNSENEGDLKYIPAAPGEEKKYLSHYGPVEETIPMREFMNIKSSDKREVKFQPSTDASMVINNQIEKYTFISPKKVEVESLGREKFSDKKEIKYTPGKY